MCDALNLSRPACLKALRDFPGLPHRSQWVADVKGVRFVDDSKGTNVGATLAAVAGMPGSLVLIAGDYNVIPTDLDVYKPENWKDDALMQPESREAFFRLTAQGWTDALRQLHPDERIYTFWDYWRNAFGRNAGIRIDHLLLNPAAAKRLKAAGVDRDVRCAQFVAPCVSEGAA